MKKKKHLRRCPKCKHPMTYMRGRRYCVNVSCLESLILSATKVIESLVSLGK